jgi:hypothetical protein
MVSFRGHDCQVHRLVAALLIGDVANKFVCHMCDSPACCNPSHLYLGTGRENNLDRHARGHIMPRILTDEDVASIREQCAAGVTVKSLSRTFCVSPATVHRAATGLTHEHLPNAFVTPKLKRTDSPSPQTTEDQMAKAASKSKPNLAGKQEVYTDVAGRYLGLPESTIRTYCANGKLVGRTERRTVLVCVKSILLYEKNRKPRGRPVTKKNSA